MGITCRKFFFLILLCFLLLVPVAAQDRPILAVPTIEAIDVSDSVASVCRNMVEAALVKTGEFQVMSATDVEDILNAQKFSLSGCTDESCAVEIGKLLSADHIVTGELTGLGEKMILALRLVDVTTGKSIGAEITTIESIDAMQELVFEASYKLAGLTYIAEGVAGVKERGSVYVLAPEGLVLEVFIDDKLRGTTPLLVENLPFGPHVLRAEKDTYVYRQEFRVDSRDIIELLADRGQLRGNLLLDIAPKTANDYTIFVDNQQKETTLIKDLAVGDHQIRIAGKAWLFEDAVTINDGETTRFPAVLTPIGTLRVEYPEGAVATITDLSSLPKPLGREKITLAAGKWVITITHPDYRKSESTITILQGLDIRLTPVLQYSNEFITNRQADEFARTKALMEKQRKNRGTGAIVSGVFGILGAGLTAIFELVISQTKLTLDENYSAYQASTDVIEAEQLWYTVGENLSAIDLFRAFRTGSLIGAGVAAITSVIFLATIPPKQPLK